MTDFDPNYRHPKCYANLHGGCSTKISGEQYFSHSMIKLYTFDDPEAKVIHNHGFGIPTGVSPKNFVVNALRVNHNTALRGTDAAALQFATFVRRIALDFLGGAGDWGGPKEITISGDDFERWALKLLLNHAAGKAFSANKGSFRARFRLLRSTICWARKCGREDWGCASRAIRRTRA